MDLPLIFGHRGAAGHYVENTLHGFQRALEMGADGFESDIYMSRDGVPFLFHDSECKLYGKSEKVKVTTLNSTDLAKVLLPNEEKVPTLADFLEQFVSKKTRAGRPILFSFDLENLGAATAASELIQKYQAEEQTYITDKWAVNFRAVRRVSPKIHLIASNSIRPFTLWTSHLPWSHYRHYHIEGFNIKAADFHLRQRETFTKNGYKFLIWDLHTEAKLRQFLPFKPWGIYSNFPDLAIKIRDEVFKTIQTS